MVRQIYVIWRTSQQISPHAFFWVEKDILLPSGEIISDLIVCPLPKTDAERKKRIEETRANFPIYAFLVIEQKPEKVRAVFTSQEGEVRWTSLIRGCGGGRRALSPLKEEKVKKHAKQS